MKYTMDLTICVDPLDHFSHPNRLPLSYIFFFGRQYPQTGDNMFRIHFTFTIVVFAPDFVGHIPSNEKGERSLFPLLPSLTLFNLVLFHFLHRVVLKSVLPTKIELSPF